MAELIVVRSTKAGGTSIQQYRNSFSLLLIRIIMFYSLKGMESNLAAQGCYWNRNGMVGRLKK